MTGRNLQGTLNLPAEEVSLQAEGESLLGLLDALEAKLTKDAPPWRRLRKKR